MLTLKTQVKELLCIHFSANLIFTNPYFLTKEKNKP